MKVIEPNKKTYIWKTKCCQKKIYIFEKQNRKYFVEATCLTIPFLDARQRW